MPCRGEVATEGENWEVARVEPVGDAAEAEQGGADEGAAGGALESGSEHRQDQRGREVGALKCAARGRAVTQKEEKRAGGVNEQECREHRS